MLINIEGISGAGKTRVIEILQELVSNDCLSLGGFNVKEYSTDLTRFCRELTHKNHMIKLPIISELHLLIAEIVMDIHDNVIPALMENRLVFYENYWSSIMFYETSIAKIIYKGDVRLIEYIKKIIEVSEEYYKIPQPDFTIFIDCEIDTAVKRIEKREQKCLTRDDIEILKEVRRLYLDNPPNNKSFFLWNNTPNENLKTELSKMLQRMR